MIAKFGVAVLVAITSSSVFAASKIRCNYFIFSAPYADLGFNIKDDGSPENYVEVTMSGRTHTESLTPIPAAPGETLHAWISKENPENTIEVFIYDQVGPKGQSKMVNEKMPMGKEMWGNCKFYR